MPSQGEWSERLRSVLHVLYLIFNEGYAASTGPQVARSELSNEAIRLTRALHTGLPEDPEVAGLLALMLLTDARRPARTGPDGELVPLAEQDRARWDQNLIAEGGALLSAVLPRRAIGEYQLQAAVAAIHDEAETSEQTDWPQILALYSLLERMTGNPMVTLNRAIAIAMVDSPAAGLAALAGLDTRLAGNHRLDAVRAHLMEMDGEVEGAIAHYLLAAGRTTSLAESNYLTARAAHLGARQT
jgi:predicted RNA polymerase sigma factor